MPEAGGASSFARRAFNEFVSFGIGWGQMLVYTATIAISALFVPHYLSVFWPILKEWPYNAIGGIVIDHRCWWSSTSSASRRRRASTSSWRCWTSARRS